MDFRLYASIFLVNDKQELLLVREGKEAIYNLWNLPGGKVEPHEKFAAAAIREAKEETGLDVTPSHLLNIFTGKDFDSVHFVFLATHYQGDIEIQDSNILEAKWVPLEEVLALGDVLLRPYKFKEEYSAYKAGRLVPLDLLSYNEPLAKN